MSEIAEQGYKEMMNPVKQVQNEIAGILNSHAWFKAHRVEIIEQNAQELSFLLKKSISSINNVVLVVGVDGITNNHTALECNVTVTCTERVMRNRAREGYRSAIDVCQAAVQVIDGEWWHFTEMKHQTEPGTDVLQAVAYFKGLVNRELLTNLNTTA